MEKWSSFGHPTTIRRRKVWSASEVVFYCLTLPWYDCTNGPVEWKVEIFYCKGNASVLHGKLPLITKQPVEEEVFLSPPVSRVHRSFPRQFLILTLNFSPFLHAIFDIIWDLGKDLDIYSSQRLVHLPSRSRVTTMMTVAWRMPHCPSFYV